jgi:hypothetical protein
MHHLEEYVHNNNKKIIVCWFSVISPQDLLGEFLFLTNLVINN